MTTPLTIATSGYLSNATGGTGTRVVDAIEALIAADDVQAAIDVDRIVVVIEPDEGTEITVVEPEIDVASEPETITTVECD